MGNYKSKSSNILKQNLMSARETMRRHEREGGDKETFERAKAIADAIRKELEARGIK